MSADRDNHDLASTSNSEKFTELLTTYVTYAAPRLFALCRESCDEDSNDWVFAWGAAFDDSAVLFNPHGRLAGTFSSAENALDLFCRLEDLCLIWVDPTMYSAPDAIAA